MARFVEGCDRGQSTLFPAVLDDYIGDDNAVRAIDVFVEGLDLAKLGFDGVEPLATGRPAYHPAILRFYSAISDTISGTTDKIIKKSMTARPNHERYFSGSFSNPPSRNGLNSAKQQLSTIERRERQ
jgi:hypothetical protein